jgi:hypothetical protein
MSQSPRDEGAEAIARSTVIRLFGADAVDHVDVFPTEDQFGEKGLSVTVFLKSSDTKVSGAQLADTLEAVSIALQGVDDFRFPYVTFLAPGYEHAEEDARPAA